MAIVTETFTSSGSWTAPAGVSHVILWGMGGGGGGAGGEIFTTSSSSGGTGASMGYTMIAVVPNTSYTITIGAGGDGGAIDGDGYDGDSTTFGALHTFNGAFKGETDAWYSFGMSGGAGTGFSGAFVPSPYGYITSTATESGGAGGRGEGGAGNGGLNDGAAGNPAAANTGGGGGAGEHSSTTPNGGVGGAGGSGWLQIIWFEG